LTELRADDDKGVEIAWSGDEHPAAAATTIPTRSSLIFILPPLEP
jgi:hypothetical protein